MAYDDMKSRRSQGKVVTSEMLGGASQTALESDAHRRLGGHNRPWRLLEVVAYPINYGIFWSLKRPQPMTTSKRTLLSAAFVAFPLWGTAGVAASVPHLPLAVGNLLYFSWFLGFLVTPVRLIFFKDDEGFFSRLILAILYLAIGSVVAFFTGWVSVCAFMSACH
ncbi:hypothetical protein [Rhodoferax sp. OV413]|uniref:hypothetical protein n=1 Tax=Rhodoferax sp. OV413 TaxID=1855285 RepID=UPI00115FE00C|nr:hypothetical protein [Rhodoferax sp. OV413]